MQTDIEISNKSKKEHIKVIAKKLGLKESDLELYGKYKAKINKQITNKKKGKLILVTAINPTPYGEGKTTISIGLGDALNLIGKQTVIALREPSLGPVFGIKGGATGGGYSQVVPMDDINLHFTGDFHAITTANNLLSAAIDNHLKQGNELEIDEDTITFRRCLDMNDRALREVEVGLGGEVNGIRRKDGFDITAASEVMIIFCLAKSLKDLENKLNNILIGFNKKGKPLFAKELKIGSCLTVILKEAFKPNLVQTLEKNPVIIHGGPFANIAHGCNSLVATNLALSLGDYVVTEAGFGSDLGAEKFMDIKCRLNGLSPDCVVLVATIKALKYNAGVQKEDLFINNPEAVRKGLPNLEAHIENLQSFGINLVVTLNKYATDTKEELEVVSTYCQNKNIPFSIVDAFAKGARGATDLAQVVANLTEVPNQFKPIYELDLTIKDKIAIIAKKIYHAKEINYEAVADKEITRLTKLGFDKLPICIAKTQYSISDDAKKLGYPKDYTLTVKSLRLYSGAGFVTVLLGDIMTMPGLPQNPAYENIYLKNDEIVGIF